MHTIAKFGLAAALLVGGANAASAVDTKAGMNADAKTKVDASTTGSIGANDRNYGSVISSIQSGTSVDLTAWNESSTVNCVALSSLQGDASGNAQALDNALSQNQDNLTSLRTSIEGNADLMTELETTCAASIDEFNADEFSAEDVVAAKSNADGSFIFYVDDRV